MPREETTTGAESPGKQVAWWKGEKANQHSRINGSKNNAVCARGRVSGEPAASVVYAVRGGRLQVVTPMAT